MRPLAAVSRSDTSMLVVFMNESADLIGYPVTQDS